MKEVEEPGVKRGNGSNFTSFHFIPFCLSHRYV